MTAERPRVRVCNRALAWPLVGTPICACKAIS